MISALRLLCPGVLAALAALPLFAGTLPDPATKKDVPPVTFVQARIYTRLDLADFTLTGKVRCDKTHKSYPVTILTKKHTMVYEFTDQPLQLKIQLDPGAFTVQRRSSSSDSWKTVPTSEFPQSILGTDITYGDLDLDFLFAWRRPLYRAPAQTIKAALCRFLQPQRQQSIMRRPVVLDLGIGVSRDFNGARAQRDVGFRRIR